LNTLYIPQSYTTRVSSFYYATVATTEATPRLYTAPERTADTAPKATALKTVLIKRTRQRRNTAIVEITDT